MAQMYVNQARAQCAVVARVIVGRSLSFDRKRAVVVAFRAVVIRLYSWSLTTSMRLVVGMVDYTTEKY